MSRGVGIAVGVGVFVGGIDVFVGFGSTVGDGLGLTVASGGGLVGEGWASVSLRLSGVGISVFLPVSKNLALR